MNFLDRKRMALALFLLPGVGVFAQTSTQGPLGVVAAGAETLALGIHPPRVSRLVNGATGAVSQAQVINGSFDRVAADPGGLFVYEINR